MVAIVRWLGDQVIPQAERLKLAYEKALRRSGRIPAGWLSDLVALKKAICLCHSCAPKFPANRVGYQEARRPPFQRGVIADCDGCKDPDTSCRYFLPEGY